MACYYCNECCEMTDNDWHPMSEDGNCPECQAEIDEQQQAREYEIAARHAEWTRKQEGSEDLG